jgi:hypothetical protein
MKKATIGYSNLGDLSELEAKNYSDYCTEVAEKAGLEIRFEITNDNASPGGIAEKISNYVWDQCDYWTDENDLRESEIETAGEYFTS